MQPIRSATVSVPPLPMQLFKTADGRWLGTITIATPTGPIKLAASANEATIRAVLLSQLMQQLQAARQQGASAGFLGGLIRKIGRIAKGGLSVVSNLARGRIAAALKSAVSLVREGLPVVALAIPGLGLVSAGIITAASSLLSRARQGDPRAKAALASNAEAARRGDPAARRRQRILVASAMKQRANRARAGRGQRGVRTYSPSQQSAQELSALSGQGSWTTAQDGSPVFTPSAMAGGVVWDQLRPHLGFRTDANSYITSRRAYADGLGVLASLRR